MTVYKHRLTCIACVMHVKITVFCDATQCSLLDTNYCFRATCSLYHQDAQIKQVCLKYTYMFTRLYGIIFHQINSLLFTKKQKQKKHLL